MRGAVVELPSLVLTHQYLDDGTSPGNETPSYIYAITITVTDDDLDSGIAGTEVTVNNVDPVITEINSSEIGEYVFAVGDSRSFTGSFTDVGTLDVHEAEWQFSHVEDLLTVTHEEMATVDVAGGGGTITDSISFALPGG